MFHAQWLLVLVMIALLVPARWLELGPLRVWRGAIPLLSLPLVGLHVAHLRSRRLALTRDGLLLSAGLGWTRVVFHSCPGPRLVALPGGGFELRGAGATRVPLEGIDASDAGAIREALKRGSPP